MFEIPALLAVEDQTSHIPKYFEAKVTVVHNNTCTFGLIIFGTVVSLTPEQVPQKFPAPKDAAHVRFESAEAVQCCKKPLQQRPGKDTNSIHLNLRRI